MSDNLSISIVIPCYNEEAAISVVLGKIAAVKKVMPNIVEVIVVDDGSTDKSSEILTSQREVTVLRSEKSEGYGAALKKGFNFAKGDLILFMDMDDTYDIQDLPKMYQLLQHKKYSIVFGNRLQSRNGMPLIRRIGNNLYHYCLKLFLLPHIGDPCTGMRLFRKSLKTEFCSLPENDLGYSMALTVRILKSKIPFGETGILYHERIGESKLNSLQDGWRFFWIILVNRLSV